MFWFLDEPRERVTASLGERGDRPPTDPNGDGSRKRSRRAGRLPRRHRPTPPECPESKRGTELERIEPELEIEIAPASS